MACLAAIGCLRPSKLNTQASHPKDHSALGGIRGVPSFHFSGEWGVVVSRFRRSRVESPRVTSGEIEELHPGRVGTVPTLDTASQVIDVPPAQLEELREEARKASRWNFLLGLLHLPGAASKARITSSTKESVLGVGLVHQTVGPRRRQVARLGRTASAGTTTAPKPNMVAMAAFIVLGVASLFCLVQPSPYLGCGVLVHGLNLSVWISSFPFVAKHHQEFHQIRRADEGVRFRRG